MHVGASATLKEHCDGPNPSHWVLVWRFWSFGGFVAWFRAPLTPSEKEEAGDEQAEVNGMLEDFSKYIREPARRKKEEEEKRKRDEEQAKEKEKKEQKARYAELKRHRREIRDRQEEIIRQRAEKLERRKAKNAKQEEIWAKFLRESAAAVERAAAMAAKVKAEPQEVILLISEEEGEEVKEKEPDREHEFVTVNRWPMFGQETQKINDEWENAKKKKMMNNDEAIKATQPLVIDTETEPESDDAQVPHPHPPFWRSISILWIGHTRGGHSAPICTLDVRCSFSMVCYRLSM